ncbi:MAG: exodeoxyribonuclease VII large subunit [Chloracidobacterium sp.]|nr:exodeoxyribonuclease VII large subunit [Chloracidobacterium sp.]
MLFEESADRRPQTVSELNSEIKSVLESGFGSVWVEGEITNFHSAASGHWYFSLTDGGSLIKAACFKGTNFRIRFKPSNGLHVRCRGRVTTYEKRGEYQLLVESLEPVGEGALIAAFEQVKARLNAEGLFDPALKRPLPPYPKRVGVVTSRTGAAVEDILTVLNRRARSVNVVIVPTLVQGEQAPEQIVAAIGLANEYNAGGADGEPLDVLIVGRGGGSAEDLWAFNDEQVARAIRASAIPVISAVGHEIDFSIADMAADLRAPTPSAAAEIVAASEEELLKRVGQLQIELSQKIRLKLLAAGSALKSAELAAVFSRFPDRLRQLGHRLELIGHRIETAVGENLSKKGIRLQHAISRLDALSPLSVLTRGYSITQKMSGEIVRDVHQTKVGEAVWIRLAKGKLEASITDISDQ